MSTLYIVSTPIGNLEDITLRALRILKEVEVVFAEDTRVASKLFNYYDIQTQLHRYDEHSHDSQSSKVIEYLLEGKNVAYISDAGTPGISDPGSRLVKTLREEQSDINIVSVPGASAIISAFSISGITKPGFEFLGFLPHKKGRETLFTYIQGSSQTIIFYESVHRIEKTLASLSEKLDDTRRVHVARELTKMFEEFVSGSPQDLVDYFKENQDKVKGEFVVIVEGRN